MPPEAPRPLSNDLNSQWLSRSRIRGDGRRYPQTKLDSRSPPPPQTPSPDPSRRRNRPPWQSAHARPPSDRTLPWSPLQHRPPSIAPPSSSPLPPPLPH